VPAAEVLLVGDDRVNDYEGARAAGLRAVLVDPTRGNTGAPDVIGNLNELLQFLDNAIDPGSV
jgi:FMN phosphatase YigB (HAD superfamily)